MFQDFRGTYSVSIKTALKDTLKSKGRINLEFRETIENGLLSTIFRIKNENALLSQESKEEWMTLHNKLGHPCKYLTKRTEDYLGIMLIGSWTECQEFLMRKANSKSANGGERFGFDISYLKNSSFGGSKFWLLVVDEVTSMVWSYFLRRKSETQKKVLEFILIMKAWDQEMVKFMRCGDSPENKRLAKEVEKKG
jgi:hypothetical protein